MTKRLSSNQFTILRSLGPKNDGTSKRLPFDRAIEFNQNFFYSLIRRGYIVLDLSTEEFHVTEDGVAAYLLYVSGSVSDLHVKNDPPVRHERVAGKLSGTSKATKRKRAA